MKKSANSNFDMSCRQSPVYKLLLKFNDRKTVRAEYKTFNWLNVT